MRQRAYESGGWSSSLDAVETTVTPAAVTDENQETETEAAAEQPFRHSGWAAHRNKIGHALERAGVSRRRIARFRACGDRCWLLKNQTNEDELVLAVEHCHDRFCLPCAQARSYRLSVRLNEICEGKDLRFFTFTLRHSDAPLQQQLDRLTKCWRKMRGTSIWKRTQHGGVAVIEVKQSKETHRWHPHLHVIGEGDFVPQSEIANTWKRITGDSFIVDVRRLRDAKEAVRYISKYASKGIDLSARSSVQDLAEAITSLGSKRLVQCYGTWSKLRTTDTPSSESWSRWITLEELLLRAASGNLEARLIIRKLQDRADFGEKCERHTSMRAPPIDPALL